MRAVITLFDLPESQDAKIGFSVCCQSDRTDTGITNAGYLVHSLTQTLQHIAIESDFLAAPHKTVLPEDRLIDSEEVVWLVWYQFQPGCTDFPPPAEKYPHRWSRQAVMAWLRDHYPRRLDPDLAQAFIRRPYPKGAQ